MNKTNIRPLYESGFKSLSDIGEWFVVNCYNHCFVRDNNFTNAFRSVCR
jgi:hypothetical protein